jgi:hypothetical protein
VELGKLAFAHSRQRSRGVSQAAELLSRRAKRVTFAYLLIQCLRQLRDASEQITIGTVKADLLIIKLPNSELASLQATRDFLCPLARYF